MGMEKRPANCCCLSSRQALSLCQASMCMFANPHSHPGKLLYPFYGTGNLSYRERKSLTHNHAPSSGRSEIQTDPATWSHHFPSDLPFFSLSSLLSTPPCYPHPTSLLLLPTALFTLSTEHPRENVFPKKTNVEEPEVGVGESLSPVRKNSAPNSRRGLRDAGQMRAWILPNSHQHPRTS